MTVGREVRGDTQVRSAQIRQYRQTNIRNPFKDCDNSFNFLQLFIFHLKAILTLSLFFFVSLSLSLSLSFSLKGIGLTGGVTACHSLSVTPTSPLLLLPVPCQAPITFPSHFPFPWCYVIPLSPRNTPPSSSSSWKHIYTQGQTQNIGNY